MFDILGLKSAGSYSEWSRIFRQEVPIAITVIKVGISFYLSVEIVKKFLFVINTEHPRFNSRAGHEKLSG